MITTLRRILHSLSLLSTLTLLLAACGSAPAAAPPAAPATAQPSAPPASTAPAPTAAPTVVPTAATEPITVVATYSILGDFVQQVGGDRVALTTLVGPGGDPHSYEPTPRDSATLAAADLLFENGLLFESWLDDLFVAAGSQARRVAVTENVALLAAPEEGHGHADEDPLVHACEYFADTPAAIAADGAIPDDHTHYVVALDDGAGAVTLSRDTDAEVRFYLGADVPFAVAVGGAPVDPEQSETVSADCEAVAIVYTYDLEPGDYMVSFGPGAGEQIALVWEAASDEEGEHSDEEAGHSDEEAGEAGHSHGEYDPHVWHDPNNAMIMVEAIRDALVAADPANAAAYAANADAYLAELKELDAFITAEVATLPEERRKLVTTHDTFGYFADRYGFTIVGTALGVTTEAADPAAGELAALVEDIRAAGVPAIFAENIANMELMETLASEAGVVLAPTLYTDALGEPGSTGATYLEMMRYNVTTMVQALAG